MKFSENVDNAPVNGGLKRGGFLDCEGTLRHLEIQNVTCLFQCFKAALKGLR